MKKVRRSDVYMMEDFTVTEVGVEKELSRLKVTEVAGPDEIHPAILRPLARIVSAPLSHLYNRSSREAYLSENWKTPDVTPIHKPLQASKFD